MVNCIMNLISQKYGNDSFWSIVTSGYKYFIHFQDETRSNNIWKLFKNQGGVENRGNEIDSHWAYT